jgi:tetratricopeptide (TPR) repeat protein
MAQIELLRGDPESAENGLRLGEEALLAMRESGSRSTVAALRGEALYRLDRYEESVAATETSEALAWPEDLLSQVVWRSARGKSLARLGDPATGEMLCREALKKIEVSDLISAHADALVSLADVLQVQGKHAETTMRLGEALALYERKENLVSARKVRARLA